MPFENLDVQLGRPSTTRVADAYDKIVRRRRGGWCYEQNGLFGWILAQLGFDVTRISGAVLRAARGDWSTATHLALVISCPGSPRRYLVDVGFGGSMLEPLALEPGTFDQPPFTLALERLDDGHWQFREDLGDEPFSFDFVDEPGAEDALGAKCEFLQSDPSSSFVQSLVAQRRTPEEHLTLRGRVFTLARTGASETRMLDSAAELVDILKARFALDVPEVAALWPRIVRRHEEVTE